MAAVDEYLVRRGDGLVLLFTPPFDQSDARSRATSRATCRASARTAASTPTAPIWSVLAFAALGDGDKAGELFSILNPINHASTRAGVHRYKVEPYVMAADVYAEPPHVGRGGWTWYTGSAGWMYQAGIEWILGFRLRGTTLADRPVHPARLAGLRDRLPLSLRQLRDRRREPAWGQPGGGVGGARRTRPAGDAAAPRSRSPTTARRTGSGSSSARTPASKPQDDGTSHGQALVSALELTVTSDRSSRLARSKEERSVCVGPWTVPAARALTLPTLTVVTPGAPLSAMMTWRWCSAQNLATGARSRTAR